MTTNIGQKITKRLAAFATALEENKTVTERFTCHRITLDLQPKPYDPKLAKKTRDSLGLSQALFAQFLGVSVKTVSAWECGSKNPKNIACRFMDEIRENPEHWRERLSNIAKPTANA